MSNLDLSIRRFDPAVRKDVDRVVELWTEYTTECLEAGEIGSGTPVAPYLNTLLVMYGKRCVGMFSLDTKRVSIELIYIKQSHRRRGIASAVLAEARETAPSAFSLKGPLSPAMQRIAERQGIAVASHDPAAQAVYDETREQLTQSYKKVCPHTGDTVRMCRPCTTRIHVPAARRAVEHAVHEVLSAKAFMDAARGTGLLA